MATRRSKATGKLPAATRAAAGAGPKGGDSPTGSRENTLSGERTSNSPPNDLLLDAAYDFFTLANELTVESDTLNQFVTAIKAVSGCEAVGIRVAEGDAKLVYGAHQGFCQGFMASENQLSIDEDHCLCSRVYSQTTDSGLSFFNRNGSFVTNDSADAGMQPDLRRLGPIRGTCIAMGYRTMALFPIRSRQQVLGLIQIADPRPNRLPSDMARLFEKVALQLGASLEKARALEALQTAHRELEEKIRQRTGELEAANRSLKQQVSQRREAEARLTQNQRMLQYVFDGISDPLVLLDRRMRVKMTNRAAQDYYDVEDPQAVVDQPCFESLGRFRTPCQSCRVVDAVKQGRHLEFERGGFLDHDRSETVVIYPLTDGQGNNRGAVMRIQDVTDAQVLRQQLDQIKNQASMGLLVSSVAHEIKNPNTFIGFNTSILKDYLGDMLPILDLHAASDPDLEICNMPYEEFREDVARMMDTIEHGVRRIDAVLANLKSYGDARVEIRRKQVSLAKIIDQVLNLVGARIRKTVSSFEVQVAEGLPELYSDDVVLEQILVNLLVNAVQAADKSTAWIRLSIPPVDAEEPYLTIQVEDNGCGMDAQTCKQIFEPFYSTKVAEGGTGLGLYVCRKLVHQLGGRLRVDSEPGKGTCFTLELMIEETL